MFRQSPRSRNQRNKGFKVKHVLQICLLLGVSIWLLYQVQHSHDKKAAIGESTHISEQVQSGNDIVKLGRKDLQPQVEGSTIEDVRHKEDHEEESMPEENEPDQQKVGEDIERKTYFIDDQRETEAKEEAEGSKDVKEEESRETRDKESKEESTESKREEAEVDKGSEEESNENKTEAADIGKDKENVEDINESKKDEAENKTGKEIEQESNESKEEQSAEESGGKDTKEEDQSKGNEREETQEKSSQEKDTTENGEGKENQSQEMKEDESESKGSKQKELTVEEMIDRKETGKEASGERKPDEKTSEENGNTTEDSSSPENQVQKGNEDKAARQEKHDDGEKLSSEVVQDFQNTQTTDGNQNTSALNMTEMETIQKNEVDTNGTNMLETGNSSDLTSGTTETNEHLPVKDQSTTYSGETQASDSTNEFSNNQNRTVDNSVPYVDSTLTILKEQTEKTEEMAGGGNSDSYAVPSGTTESKDLANGESMESPNNTDSTVSDGKNVTPSTESVVSDEQSANHSTTIETQEDSENSTGSVDSDSVQKRKSESDSATPGTEENRKFSDENGKADSGQSSSGDFSTPDTKAEKEASTSTNDNADATQHDEVDSSTASSIPQDDKEAHTDLVTLPENGTDGNNHEDAAEE